MNNFEQGFAFIVEADTEMEFYKALINHFCRLHPECTLELCEDAATYEPFYALSGPFGKRIIRFNSIGTITQMHNSASWYNSVCLSKGQTFPWTVFLCYDTDEYESDITKFYQDDWKTFREKVSRRRLKRIVDLAASADIEDVFLLDLHGISIFMERKDDLSSEDIPSGRKGSAKFKQLFIQQRKLGETTAFYHKGERSRELIDCLDLGMIVKTCNLPLFEIECIFI